MTNRTVLLTFLLFFASQAAAAQSIDYVVSFPDRHHNLVDVDATIPTGGAAEVVLFMPVWTPGSYLVREFERNVQEIRASANGRPLTIEKVAKNRWAVRPEGAGTIRLQYRLFAREMSVRTNYVEPRFAILNGAATFITRLDALSLPHTVRIDLPSDWNRAASGMPSPAPQTFRARDYDHLVDSPIVAGTLDVRQFSISGTPHYVVSFGDLRFADLSRIAKDVEAVARQNYVFWRELPYESYWLLNAMVDGSGGLEHENSTLIMTNRFLTRSRTTYVNWLETVSHEIFHAWNVKALRPAGLLDIDYENEEYTTELWFAEGFTDYYGALLVKRAGLMTEDEYLASLSQQIRNLQGTPGRERQSAELASYDAWIRFYRPDENSPNVAVSYYTKGHVIAFVLDAAIRSSTAGVRSLDDMMRRVWQRQRASGITRQAIEKALAEIGSPDLVPLLRQMTTSTYELDYDIPLDLYRLRFRPSSSTTAGLGMTTTDSSGRLLIRTPMRGGAAWKAGLQPEDEIVAIDGVRLTPGELNERLTRYRPSDEVQLLIARRGTMMTLPVTLEESAQSTWQLEHEPTATAGQRARREEWLGDQGN